MPRDAEILERLLTRAKGQLSTPPLSRARGWLSTPPSLGRVGAQREAYCQDGGDGGAGHLNDQVVGLWERRVEEDGAHLVTG